MKYTVHVEDVTDSETIEIPDKAVSVRLAEHGNGVQVLSYLAPIKRAPKKTAKKVTKSAGVKKAPAKKK